MSEKNYKQVAIHKKLLPMNTSIPMHG